MISETLNIANMKCSGCANTIRENLYKIEGLDSVLVREEEDQIDLTYDNPIVRNQVIKKLHKLGYPEATAENGLLLKTKSYASCMIGRMKKQEN